MQQTGDSYASLTLDAGHENELSVGDTARVCIRGDGQALLTLEREGVLRHELHQVGRVGKVVTIPITSDLHPDVTVSLHGVRRRTAPFPIAALRLGDHGHPTSSSESISLRVAAPERRLTVSIDTPPEVRPGDEVTARVTVKDGAGRPAVAQVTSWAVDEGAFLLEPFKVPDLQHTFQLERGSDVVQLDTRDLLLWERLGTHHSRSHSVRMGSTSVSHGTKVGRMSFRPTAWFLPDIVTGPDGVATVKARLPDNLTSWKVFAVAVTVGDGFGSGESSFRTNKQLMVRPGLPRFMRVGDRVDATVIIDSLVKAPLNVKVSMRASGVLATRGVVETSLVVPAEGHVPVRFALDAPSAGHGKVSFHVEAPGEKLADDVTVDTEVSTPGAQETIVISGETRSRTDEPLGDLSRVRTDVGGLDFRLSTSPLVGLAESLAALVEYPYGCTEQLTSRLVPLVRLRALSRELGVTLPADVDASVRSSIASLLSHQRKDGGFGFWPDSSASEAWLTITSLNALHATRGAGYEVPAEPIARAVAYLEKSQGHEGLDAGSRAMLEDMFASQGKPREKELRALAAEVLGPGGRATPGFGRALVAHALAKVDPQLGARVLEGVASRARLSGATAVIGDEATLVSRSHLSSDVRTTAMVLRAFVALDPGNALVTKLVRGLLSLRRDGRWRTTQENAWALLALDDARPLFAPSGGATSARLVLDGNEVARATFSPPARASNRGSLLAGTLPMSRLAAAPGATLSFTSEGGPLFYEAALRYARKEPPRTPLEHGIHVVKSMRVLRRGAEPVETGVFHVGDYVEVDVRLAAPVPLDLVVLDDPLPSGFEAVNQRYATRDRQMVRPDASDRVTHRELRDDRVVTFFDHLPAGQHHTSYVVRVVSGGRFVVPATKAECMYAPDVFGRTAAAIVDASP